MFGSHPAWITADAFFYFLEFFLKKIVGFDAEAVHSIDQRQ